MFEFIKAGGWLMLPILACSIAALAITLERLWTLRKQAVVPPGLMNDVFQKFQGGLLTQDYLVRLQQGSPLGRILAAGVVNHQRSREVMTESIEEEGRQVVHGLERYLNTLGMIISISPLLGLLGTVIGMIEVFAAIVSAGVGNPGVLAGGISKALITTAAGLSVAIPALVFHRYLASKVDRLALEMERQAIKLVEVMHGERGL